MLRQTPLSTGYTEDQVKGHPAWQLSKHGPGAVEAMLERVRAWKRDTPNRKLRKLVKKIDEQRRQDRKTGRWAEVASEEQLAEVRDLLQQGADPNQTIKVSGNDRTLLEMICDGSPKSAVLLIQAGATVSQTILETAAIHTLIHKVDDDEAFVEIYDQLKKDEHPDRWEAAKAIRTELAWKEVLNTFVETPQLDWYRRLKGSEILWIERHTPVSALGDQYPYGACALRESLKAAQEKQGEHIGRPPLPSMSQEEMDEMLYLTVARHLSYNQKSEVLNEEERWMRSQELLKRGANPNFVHGPWGRTCAEEILLYGFNTDEIRYLDLLVEAGAKCSDKVAIKKVEDFIYTMKVVRDQEAPEGMTPAQLNGWRKGVVSELEHTRKVFINHLHIMERMRNKSIDGLNYGQLKQKLDDEHPGTSEQVELGRMMENTAQAKRKTQKGMRL